MFITMPTTHLDVPQLRTQFQELGLPWEISYHPTSRSTQLDAHGLIATHGPGQWLVIAERQEGGRGRGGRRWLSDIGDLAATWTVPLELAPERYAKLTLLGGLIAAEAIREVMGIAVGVKWPNDIYWDGQKCGGCLGELRLTPTLPVACLGIGINLVPKDLTLLDSPPMYPVVHVPSDDPAATRDALLLAISRMLHERATWVHPEHDADFGAWWNALHVMGSAPIRVMLPGNTELTGIPGGLTPHGELLVTDESGASHVVAAGDVHL